MGEGGRRGSSENSEGKGAARGKERGKGRRGKGRPTRGRERGKGKRGEEEERENRGEGKENDVWDKKGRNNKRFSNILYVPISFPRVLLMRK